VHRNNVTAYYGEKIAADKLLKLAHGSNKG
jgi:hypothetical protein